MRQSSYIKWVSQIVRGASAASIFLVGAVLFSGSFLVGGTLLYARGVETLQERHPALNPIDFTFAVSDDSFEIKDGAFLDLDDTVVFTSTLGSDTPRLLYHITGAYSAGDTDLCEAIRATSVVPEYDGQLQSLDVVSLNGFDSTWKFNLSLDDGAVLQQGAECIVTIRLLGWDEKRTMHLEKYRAENSVELTFKVDGTNLIESLIESVSDAFTDTESDEESTQGGDATETTDEEVQDEPTDVPNKDTPPSATEVLLPEEATTTESMVMPEVIVEDESPEETDESAVVTEEPPAELKEEPESTLE